MRGVRSPNAYSSLTWRSAFSSQAGNMERGGLGLMPTARSGLAGNGCNRRLLEAADYAAASSEVQKAQRVALMGMADRQRGHSLVVGSSGGASSFFCSLVKFRMMRKTQKAMMMNVMMVMRKGP